MRAVAKVLRARASEHSSQFCDHFEQRPNFASTFKLNGSEDDYVEVSGLIKLFNTLG